MLEQTIVDEPDNLDNWTIYIDYLLSVQPDLGERAALGLALIRARDDAERARLRIQIDAYEREHAKAWFGARLAEELPGLEAEGTLDLDRRFGLILGARLRDGQRGAWEFGVVVRALLDSPLARVLRSLHIEAKPLHDHQFTFLTVVSSIIERRLPTLRELTLDDRHGAHIKQLPRAQVLLDRMPRLERLELHGPFRGAAKHSSLRELKLVPRPDNPVWPFVRWRLPAVEVLHVETYSHEVDWSQIELPRLRRLLIDGIAQEQVVESLARSSFFAQLDSLVLVGVSAEGVAAIETHADRFAAVGQLILLDAEIDPQAAADLPRAWPNALVRTRAERQQAWRRRDAQPDPLLLEHDRLTKF